METAKVGDTILITGEDCLSKGMEVVVTRVDPDGSTWFAGKIPWETYTHAHSYKIIIHS